MSNTKWKVASDITPEKQHHNHYSKCVLAYSEVNKCMYTSAYDYESERWALFSDLERELRGVTHWMSLPDLPENTKSTKSGRLKVGDKVRIDLIGKDRSKHFRILREMLERHGQKSTIEDICEDTGLITLESNNRAWHEDWLAKVED